MPFKSMKQERWMYANKPGMAKSWSAKYGHAESKSAKKKMKDMMRKKKHMMEEMS